MHAVMALHTHAAAAVRPWTALQQRLSAALGPGIGVACTGVDGDPEHLWPIEQFAIRNAIPRRQREFAAGRAAAREAMRRVGLPPAAIPSAPDRSPVWPDGVVGSIAHTAGVCVAVAGRRAKLRALGIDIEEDRPLDPSLWAHICNPQELAVLTTLNPSEQGRWCTRIFCAKEAYYKWQYPQTGQMLEFGEVHITFSPDQTAFRAHQPMAMPDDPSQGPPRAGEGRLLTVEGVVLAWLTGGEAAH